MPLVTVYLGLGSNLGDREGNLTKALERLSPKAKVEAVSSLYETEPVGYKEQPWFLNAVCQAATELSPLDLLNFVKEVEHDLGRLPTFPNGPRPIDIDILFYGNQVIQTSELTIPHPRLGERAFVLIPLAELAPELLHPVTGAKIGELVAVVTGREGVRRWGEGKKIVAGS